MNVNQAKSIAGIKYSIKTREDYARAERDCVKLIIAARKSGDENRAAELGGAKSIFQKRSRTKKRCAVCGETIARGATHCRIHARQQNSKLISLPVETPKAKLKRNNNARVYIKPSGGLLAEIGFYSNEVVDVFEKWAKTIHPDTLKSYYIQVACPVIQSHRGDAELRLPVKTENSDCRVVFKTGNDYLGRLVNNSAGGSLTLGAVARTE
jgi:hypothetical protein